MIQSITLLILSIFDFFHKKRIFKFLKKNNLTEFNVFFDIGAHKGETIYSFGKNLNLKKIYSFEPSPISYEVLNRNKKKLQIKIPKSIINIENLAIGSSKKEIKIKHFFESSSSTIKNINSHSNYFKKKKKFLSSLNSPNYFKEFLINQITIDEYMQMRNIKNIDFLKIDTEGYEYEIVLGANKNLKKIKLILFEHHYDDMIFKGYKFRDINSFLLKNDFKQIYKVKMPFRKTFEYIYKNKTYISK